MSLLVGIGTGGGCGCNFGDIVRKLNPWRVEIFTKFGCFGLLVVPLDEGGRCARFIIEIFHGIRSTGLEVINS